MKFYQASGIHIYLCIFSIYIALLKLLKLLQYDSLTTFSGFNILIPIWIEKQRHLPFQSSGKITSDNKKTRCSLGKAAFN